ncbi:MAG: TIGR04219 family outer membrane beta-barrel protein [Epsilonproteobacteria bacterium]|nr:TIGR04219 family outer membrane beta-barrel protein [Campylobacterota bacterium]
MKKILLMGLIGLSAANAEIIGMSGGVGIWKENISGYIKTGDNINYLHNQSALSDGNDKTGDLGLANKSHPYVWLQLIHPLPLIPNIKLQYTRYDTSGDGVASGDLKIFNKTITANSAVHTDLTIDSYDMNVFYNIEPIVANINVGVGVNVLCGDTSVTVKSTNQTSSASFTTPIAYLYANVDSMTLFGMSASAQVKYLNISSLGHYYDYDFNVQYHLSTVIIDATISVGYRYQDILAKDGDDETNLKFNGGYAQIGLKW